MAEVFASIGIYISIPKTEALWLCSKPEDASPIMIGEHQITEVEEFKYLGSVFNNCPGNPTEAAVREGIKRGRKALRQITSVARLLTLSKCTRRKLVKTVVYPAAYFASETWRVTQASEKKLGKFVLIL